MALCGGKNKRALENRDSRTPKPPQRRAARRPPLGSEAGWGRGGARPPPPPTRPPRRRGWLPPAPHTSPRPHGRPRSPRPLCARPRAARPGRGAATDRAHTPGYSWQPPARPPGPAPHRCSAPTDAGLTRILRLISVPISMAQRRAAESALRGTSFTWNQPPVPTTQPRRRRCCRRRRFHGRSAPGSAHCVTPPPPARRASRRCACVCVCACAPSRTPTPLHPLRLRSLGSDDLCWLSGGLWQCEEWPEFPQSLLLC
jgi:hypothetical protein